MTNEAPKGAEICMNCDFEEPGRDIEAKVKRMLAAGAAIRAHLLEPVTSDHSCLYDDNGFPR